MDALKKVVNFLAPDAKKGDDGRDVFGSRAAFVLCAMGGAVGLGNLLRFPSIVFNNHGLQFFIPYLIALLLVAIPVLILEISIGQAYRGGCILAWHHINKRTKGVGWSVVFNGYAIVTYYVPILAFIMNYFRNSFISPLPWAGRVADFFELDVVANVPSEGGEFNDDGSIASYVTYPGRGMVAETVGWSFFTWFVVWLCMFKGVGLTGRVIYITMALPLIMIIILVGRSVTLPNAVDGIRLYFATWRGSTLGDGQIWQGAFGQIFFSIGVGLGYFTSYASYSSRYSNAVQDAFIIGLSNSLVEVVAAFAVFGVVGYLGLHPDESDPLSTFASGFYTYPEALAQMPASNFWSVVFFATLFLLGLTSAFALLEAMTTLVVDTDWGKRVPRWSVASTITVVSFLISLIYCSEFGFAVLDAVDTWVNNLALFFVVWCECVAATTLYRYKDVVDQVGLPAFLIYNSGYALAQIIGLAIAHSVGAEAGAGTGFGIFIVTTVVGVIIARVPTIPAPRFWASSALVSRFWWLTAYSGNQLRRDLNVIIGAGKNWKIPILWAPILKYISAPVLAIVLAFAYPSFYSNFRNDPIHIYAFVIVHTVMIVTITIFIFPRFFDILIPKARRGEGDYPVAPGETFDIEVSLDQRRGKGDGVVIGEYEVKQ